jgi:pectinesterase
MIKKIFSACLILSLLSFGQKSFPIAVENPLSQNRPEKIVTVKLDGLFGVYPELSGKNLIVFDGKKELTSQMVDENSDGVFDLLLFQASFKSNETKQFAFQISKKTKNDSIAKVDGRYVLPREDFAWENDRIAFRIYGSALAGNVDNGIDVWTKRVRYPIVKKWYDGEERTPKIVYHEDHGEGADFFSVGRSLGAGSAGILWNGKLLQPGLFSYYRIITNGPLRISVEVYYPTWKFDTSKYLEIKLITLDAGEQLNKIEEQFISNSSQETLILAAGLVKRTNTTLKRNTDNRWMSLWGLTNTDSINGSLGTAVVFPFAESVSAIEDSVQYLMATTIEKKKTFIYYSGAAWTRMGDIANENAWVRYLDDFVNQYDRPLVVSFHHQKKK